MKGFGGTWDLVCDRSWLPTFAFMFFGIGEFLSLPLYFYVSYKHGRRFSFFVFLAGECLFGGVTAVAPNIGCFIVLRFLLGLTVPATVATPASLAQELVGPKWRGQLCYCYPYGQALGGSVSCPVARSATGAQIPVLGAASMLPLSLLACTDVSGINLQYYILAMTNVAFQFKD
ncbi:hypothetical protein JTE90_007529 [Oedothorax gibbosus]|uniref:Major facilitator superfamily (MFS) profile domain-containing protein n=1 Tax=Oedothorax gibbosus TaxID=931172 RepID=A0AAV6VNI6_9ARAC|nr:hypothetical protein JTE90_007529 [Oedothorax gibbosus]